MLSGTWRPYAIVGGSTGLPAGLVGLVAAVGRDLTDELLERHREVVAEEGGQEVDPALELGGLHRACAKMVR
jgi:hypothetical protein